MQVYLIGLAEAQSATGSASKYDSYALDKMSIRVSPKVFGARIRCAYPKRYPSQKGDDEIDCAPHPLKTSSLFNCVKRHQLPQHTQVCIAHDLGVFSE